MLCRRCCKHVQSHARNLHSWFLQNPPYSSLPRSTTKPTQREFKPNSSVFEQTNQLLTRHYYSLISSHVRNLQLVRSFSLCDETKVTGSQDDINKKFDLLSRDQGIYLERIKSDYETAFDASSKRQSAASERYLSKFGTLYNAYMGYNSILQDIVECHNLLNDNDMRAVAMDEIKVLSRQLKLAFEDIESEIMFTLQDQTGDILLEVQMATGGLESAMFAADLLGLYELVSAEKGFRWNVIELEQRGSDNGVAHATVEISGDNVYNMFQYEAGVHRVQRIPATDASRVHTSTAIVIITLKPDNIETNINPDDLDIRFDCASGPGGQYVNKTHSKCNMLHIPSGIRVWSQRERDSRQNKEDCLQKLHALLLKREIEQLDQSQSNLKKQQAKTGDRSDKIRTYNYTGNKVTDHITSTTVYPKVAKSYFTDTSKFLELHKAVSKVWQLKKLSEIANNIGY